MPPTVYFFHSNSVDQTKVMNLLPLSSIFLTYQICVIEWPHTFALGVQYLFFGFLLQTRRKHFVLKWSLNSLEFKYPPYLSVVQKHTARNMCIHLPVLRFICKSIDRTHMHSRVSVQPVRITCLVLNLQFAFFIFKYF